MSVKVSVKPQTQSFPKSTFLVEVSILSKDSRMFQSYLSWIPTTSFPFSTRQWGHLWWTFHHSLICSGKERILCLTSMWGSSEVRNPPKSSAGFPGTYRFLSAEARMNIFILSPACPVLTAGLESSSTSNLSFQRSNLTKTSYILDKGTVASAFIVDSWCKDLSSSYGHDSITMCSASVASMRIKKKIFNSRKFQKTTLEFVICQQLFP